MCQCMYTTSTTTTTTTNISTEENSTICAAIVLLFRRGFSKTSYLTNHKQRSVCTFDPTVILSTQELIFQDMWYVYFSFHSNLWSEKPYRKIIFWKNARKPFSTATHAVSKVPSASATKLQFKRKPKNTKYLDIITNPKMDLQGTWVYLLRGLHAAEFSVSVRLHAVWAMDSVYLVISPVWTLWVDCTHLREKWTLRFLCALHCTV